MTALSNSDSKRNQYLLLGFFIYTTFHGALRKWVFMGSSAIDNILFFFQLVMPFLVIFFMKRETPAYNYKPLIPYALLLMAMALNPLNETLFHGFFGFLLHFGFWLIMLAYINERDAFPLENIVKALIIICFVQAALGFLQFSLPSTHFINRYVSSDNVDGFENDQGVRIIGTFSYIAGYGSFLFFFGLFVWALMVENKRTLLVVFGLAGMGLVSAFMNGSRATVLPFIISIIFGFMNYGSFGTKIKSVAAISGLIILALIFNVDKKLVAAERAFNAFQGRVQYGQKSGEAQYRTIKTFVAVVDFRGNHPIFGLGLGATYQGAISKWGKSAELGYFEEEPERVLLEGGYLLFIVRSLLFFYLISQLKIPLVFSIPILFYVFFFTQMIFNTYQATYVFFGIALIDKMYYLKSKEKTAIEP